MAEHLDPELRRKLAALYDDGRRIFERFDEDVRTRNWHPFIPADYEHIQQALLPYRGPRLRFLEWGSATGVITIMADLLGFEAYGIEIDAELVAVARELAKKFDSSARFAAGSFLPAGYEWKGVDGDTRLGTIGTGISGYQELQHPLEDFDLVYGYPWGGEEPIMHDVMRCYGSRDAYLLIHGRDGVQVFRNGRQVGGEHSRQS